MARVCLTLALSFAYSAQGERFFLFSAPGVQSENYAEVVRQLLRDDVLVFSDGEEFTVKSVLGQGNTTLVIDIVGNRVLRIPLSSGNASISTDENGKESPIPLGSYTSYITEFIEGHRALTAAGVRVVKMYEHLREEYVVVEKLSPRFNYRWYFHNRRTFSEGFKRRVDAQLLQFVSGVSLFAKIGDFHPEQLVYNESEWVLLDFTTSTTMARYQNDVAPFLLSRWHRVLAWMGRSQGVHLPPDLEPRVRDLVSDLRTASGLKPVWHLPCRQTLDVFSFIVGNRRQRQRAALRTQ